MPEEGENQNQLFQQSQFQRSDMASIVVWLGQMDHQVALFEHDLRGEEYKQSDTGGEWKVSGKAKMNEEGIRFVISTLRSVVCTPNTYYSIIDENRLNEMCFHFATDVASNLGLNMKRYGLSFNDYAIINEKFQWIMELALRRSLNGKGLDMIMTTEHTVRSLGQQEHKKGILDRLFNW